MLTNVDSKHNFGSSVGATTSIGWLANLKYESLRILKFLRFGRTKFRIGVWTVGSWGGKHDSPLFIKFRFALRHGRVVAMH